MRRADDLAAGHYPAFAAAVDFASHAGVPEPEAFTSGWYLPSLGQWLDFLRNVTGHPLHTTGSFGGTDDLLFCWTNLIDIPTKINNVMDAIPAADKTAFETEAEKVWTSTAVSAGLAYVVIMDRSGRVDCTMELKTNSHRVRCAIAF